jgi:hypothetical protein
MVDHRRRDEWQRRSRRRVPDGSAESDEERALRELQETAGNRAVSDALTSMHETGEPALPSSSADSPGLRVLAALRAGPVPVQRHAGGGLLRRGMTGPEVEALQADLAHAGYPVAVDGIFGGATQAAVLAFQRAMGLAVDGIVGPATRGALTPGGKEVGKEAGKEAAKGSVEKEAWAPGEAEIAAKEAAAKEAAGKEGGSTEAAAKDLSSVEKEAWVPDKGEAAAKEAIAKKESDVEKEAWAPEIDEEAAKEGAVKQAGAKEAGDVEKEDWWLT